jgi:hypothetical protein
MPWEKTRLLRLLNVNTRTSLATTVPQPVNTKDLHAHLGRWQNSTPFSAHMIRHEADIMMPTFRRAARLMVALVDWRREFGELPESLDALVGPYFQMPPLNPMVMQPFFYSSTGIPIDLTIQYPNGEVQIVLPKDRPFLWSPQHPLTKLDAEPEEIIEEGFLERHKEVRDTMRNGHIWLVPEPVGP